MYEINFAAGGHIYFIGIGGISMSGLAQVLLKRNFKISGSDFKKSPLTEALTQAGATVYYSQVAQNITKDIDIVVYTAAIHPDHPEYQAAVSLGIPMLSRAELLGQMMRGYELPIAISGTHGKTTTTSMVSEILLAADTDPTLSIGGVLKTIGGNIRVGGSKYFVTEACEYTNSFLSFFPKIGIILNIEEDHLDFFKDLADIRNSFHAFARLLPEDGALIINGTIENLSELTEDLSCKIITFGPDASFDYYPEDITYVDGRAHFILVGGGKSRSIALSVPGEHNIYNACAAVALADLFDLNDEAITGALTHFTGSDRRFEYKGSLNGITIIDDYAHHPTEIRATLTAAKEVTHQKLWCIFQPHTYTRTKAFLTDFAKALSLADEVILADIYAARETDTLGISSATLRDEIVKLGCSCTYLDSFSKIEEFVLKNCTSGDLLITMGAGDVVKIGENLLSQ